MTIKVHKAGGEVDSDPMTEEINSKMISLEDRLERELESQKFNSLHINNQSISAAKIEPLADMKNYFQTKEGLHINLCKLLSISVRKNANCDINVIESIKISVFNPTTITSLDLSIYVLK